MQILFTERSDKQELDALRTFFNWQLEDIIFTEDTIQVLQLTMGVNWGPALISADNELLASGFYEITEYWANN